jgi:hypothetical protein
MTPKVRERRPLMPAKKPAAQPPAMPFNASCFSRWFATMDSVAANVAPMAAAKRGRQKLSTTVTPTFLDKIS